MAADNIILERPAQKQLNKLPIPIHKRILEALRRIKTNPLSGIKLHGEMANYHKLRVGDYRIVYFFDLRQNSIKVVKIEHRQGVYK